MNKTFAGKLGRQNDLPTPDFNCIAHFPKLKIIATRILQCDLFISV